MQIPSFLPYQTIFINDLIDSTLFHLDSLKLISFSMLMIVYSDPLLTFIIYFIVSILPFSIFIIFIVTIIVIIIRIKINFILIIPLSYSYFN
jgi:hypothetical protein